LVVENNAALAVGVTQVGVEDRPRLCDSFRNLADGAHAKGLVAQVGDVLGMARNERGRAP